MDFRVRSAGMFVVVLLGAGLLAQLMMPVLTVSGPKVPRTIAEASLETISYIGIGPTSISLSWTESTDLTFTSYALRESTDAAIGPWTVIDNIYVQGNTSYYFSGLTPGATEWWEVVYHNTTGSRETIPALQAIQPSTASLSVSLLTSTTAQLSWDNNAMYGGLLSFDSYRLLESTNGGVYSITWTTTDVTQHGYIVGELFPSTDYSFYLYTTDQCSCPARSPSSSDSETVSIQTPGPLTSSINPLSSIVEVGEPALFNCVAMGGKGPYTFSWVFGDGITGAGVDTSHNYTTTGAMTVVCTVTDTLGATAVYSIEVKVGSDPSITAFIASPASLSAGEKVTFRVSTSGGYGGLSYSYASLPTGCLSTNSTTLSCTPTSSGNYDVTVTAIDHAGESATARVSITVEPQKVPGLPQVLGLAVIFSGVVGIGAIVIVSVSLTLRRRRGRQATTGT